VRVGPVRLPVSPTLLFVEHAGADQGVTDGVWIAVAARPSILQVALLLLSDAAGDADADIAIGHSRAEVVDIASLALAGQPALVVLSSARVVRLDVPEVLLAELVDGLLDLGDAVLVAHRFRREVRMGASAIPRAIYRFWIQSHDHSIFFGDVVQDEPGDP